MKTLSISIVLYKTNLKEIKKFLYICDQINVSNEIFIIDNFKHSKLISKIKMKKNYNYISLSNVGFAKGHNYVIKNLKSKYHIICNTDIKFNPKKIKYLIDFIKKRKTVAVLGPKIIDKNFKNFGNQKLLPSPNEIFLRRFFKKSFINKNEEFNKNFFKIDKPLEVLNISGCFMFFKTKIFKKLKGFDERYFMYFDDVDICRKVIQINKKIFYFPKFIVKHTARSSHRSNLKLFFISIISAIKYFLKWGFLDKKRNSLNLRFIKKVSNFS